MTEVVPARALPSAQQQHMLFLFFPLKKGSVKAGLEAARTAFGPRHSTAADSNGAGTNGADPRVAPGVHFFMLFGLECGQSPAPAPLVPTFSTPPGSDMLVVMSIYDRDFTPYISAFTSNPLIAYGLDKIVKEMDEPSSIDPTDPTSAHFIEHNGGVAKNNAGFIKLLMRYNFADPTIAATTGDATTGQKYFLGGTFPGLTVGSVLDNYPDAETLWPAP
ncbi:MAG TPA: hypothetical protein VEA60_05595 [Allosphingosinicella sp.]|nr:hypothetical protein [Allosphingosinicella sp.]